MNMSLVLNGARVVWGFAILGGVYGLGKYVGGLEEYKRNADAQEAKREASNVVEITAEASEEPPEEKKGKKSKTAA